MVLDHALGDLASEYFEPLLPKSLITVTRKSRYSLLFASGRWTDVFAILSKFHIFDLLSYLGYLGGFTVTRLILFVYDSGATPRGHRLVRMIATWC